MIGRITGTLIEKSPPVICVDVNGIGYDIDVPMSTLYQLPETGQRVSLFTHLAVRDDAHTLYGFANAQERNTFRILIKVSGIGARTALAILSGMTAEELSQHIAQQDTAPLMRIPGIGRKTADRLLLELRDKLPQFGEATPTQTGGSTESQDIPAALSALGYSASEVKKAMKTLPKDINVTEGIRLALQNLARR